MPQIKPFKKSVAEAANVETADVTIIDILDAPARRGNSVLVDVSVKATSEASAIAIASNLSSDNLNSKLEANGLQAGVMVQGPTVSSLNSPTSSISSALSGSASYVFAIAGVAAGVLLLTCSLMGGWRYHLRKQKRRRSVLPLTVNEAMPSQPDTDSDAVVPAKSVLKWS